MFKKIFTHPLTSTAGITGGVLAIIEGINDGFNWLRISEGVAMIFLGIVSKDYNKSGK